MTPEDIDELEKGMGTAYLTEKNWIRLQLGRKYVAPRVPWLGDVR